MGEIDIQRSIIDYLKILEKVEKLYFFRAGAGLVKLPDYKGKQRVFRSGRPGCPDIIVCYKGRFIGLEVKTDKGRLNTNQSETAQKIEDAGGEYWVVRSIDDVIKILNILKCKL